MTLVFDVGNCATSEVILVALVLYFLAPPTRDYIDVITHVNPRKNKCKPWIRLSKENNKTNILVFPQGRSTDSIIQVGPVRVKVSFYNVYK